MITKQLRFKYNEDGFIFPTLEYGVFKTAAINNVDDNPLSTGAKSSFHGTSISVLQHLDSKIPMTTSFKLDESVSNWKNMGLPATYTDIMQEPQCPSSNAHRSLLFMLIFIQSKHWKMYQRQSLTNLIFASTHFRVRKMVLHPRFCMQN